MTQAAHTGMRVLASDLHEPPVAYWQQIQVGWVPPHVVTEDEYKAAMADEMAFPAHMRAHILYNASWGREIPGWVCP